MTKHSALASAGWHVTPGLLNTLVYIAIAYLLRDSRYPPMLAMLIASILVLLPLELFIVVRGRSTRPFYLADIRATVRWPLYLLTAVLSSLLLPGIAAAYEPTLQAKLFSWVPSWAQVYSFDGFHQLERPEKILLVTLAFLVFGVAGPVVEELYFRAFLLPRIAHWGNAAAVWSAFLFAVVSTILCKAVLTSSLFSKP